MALCFFFKNPEVLYFEERWKINFFNTQEEKSKDENQENIKDDENKENKSKGDKNEVNNSYFLKVP